MLVSCSKCSWVLVPMFSNVFEMPWFQEVAKLSSTFFFDFICLTGSAPSGLSLMALRARQGMCPLGDKDLLRLQGTLWTMWMDKAKSQQESVVNAMLRSIPDKLWNPEFARQGWYLCDGHESCGALTFIVTARSMLLHATCIFQFSSFSLI